MTRQIIPSGVPTRTMLQAVADQNFITASTTQRLGMSSIPAGMHCHDTSLHRDFYWNGSTWVPIAGSDRVRCAYASTDNSLSVANATPTDLEFALAEREEDTDGFIANANLPGHTFHAPFDGVYSFQCAVYFSGQVGSLGGYIKFTRGGAFNDYVIRNIPSTGSEDSLSIVAYTMIAGDTFKFTVAQTTGGGLTANYRVSASWDSP